MRDAACKRLLKNPTLAEWKSCSGGNSPSIVFVRTCHAIKRRIEGIGDFSIFPHHPSVATENAIDSAVTWHSR